MYYSLVLTKIVQFYVFESYNDHKKMHKLYALCLCAALNYFLVLHEICTDHRNNLYSTLQACTAHLI